jgi:hypothetical protein
MKNRKSKKNIKNPIASFTPPPIVAGFDWENDNTNYSTPDDAPTTNNSSNNGIGWINAISNALGGLLDKFSPIARSIWGGDKSANVVDDSRNTTNFILIGGVIIVVIILVLFLNKK